MQLTDWLSKEQQGDGHRPAQRDLRGAGGPDPAGDPGPVGRVRRHRQRARRTVRDQPAGRLPAPEGAGTSRPDHPDPLGAMAFQQPERRATARGHRVDGALPDVLGHQPGPAGRPPQTPATATHRPVPPIERQHTMNGTTRQDLVITREFDAPRELVYRAFVDPDQLAAWFGPVGYSVPRDSVSVEAK